MPQKGGPENSYAGALDLRNSNWGWKNLQKLFHLYSVFVAYSSAIRTEDLKIEAKIRKPLRYVFFSSLKTQKNIYENNKPIAKG